MRFLDTIKKILHVKNLRTQKTRQYQGASNNPRLLKWYPSNAGPNTEILKSQDILRRRARDLYRNVPYARKAVESLVNYIVGTGVNPIFRTGNTEIDHRASELWKKWSEECYTISNVSFQGLQEIAVRAWIIDGEVLIRRRYRRLEDGYTVPLQIQLYEGDQLDISKDGKVGDRQVIGGIEFDQLGQRRAYWLYKEHPNEIGIYTGTESKPVPASMVSHLYREERPGQVRGVTWLAPVMTSLWDFGSYLDAERMRKRAEACVVAFVTGGNPEEANPDELVDGLGQATLTDASGNAVEELYPGAIIHLPPYKDVKFNVPTATPGLREYANVMLHEIASGLGVPYEFLTSDLSQVNFTSMRMGQVQFRVYVRNLRRHYLIPLLCKPILKWWIDACVVIGLLPDIESLYNALWTEPHIEEVDRLREAQADLLELRNGTSSWNEIVSARGKDPEALLTQISDERKKFDKLGIALDSDPNKTTKAGDAPALRAIDGILDEEVIHGSMRER